jgi:superfamily II RNA helicase
MSIYNCPATFPFDDAYAAHFQSLPFTLSPFQKWAIKAIVDGDNVLITAHTGSGKTLPAEFAINFFKAQNKKVIYASPIKALSNQKLYDMRRKYPHISFGLLTGDCKDNPEADVLIMTTEILRNTLFNRQQQTTDRAPPLAFHMNFATELAAVVFDEVHYINDADRGAVWEQAILLLPPHVQLIMLSATIDRPDAFATWILQEKAVQARTAGVPPKQMYLASTLERVVPLTHYLWLAVHSGTIKKAAKTPYEKKLESVNGVPLMIADAQGQYQEATYYKVKDILEYHSKHQLYVKRQFVLDSLVRYLNANDMLPAICFIFSRKHVEQAANECSFSLHAEDSSIPVLIERECRHILAEKLVNYKEYLALPEYQAIVKLLEKGIAIHHAGLMPVLREMIELLFERGYVKLLFATETFAVGINMPTKTVIFTGLTKFNGTTMRLLYPHEYTQMAGRAGRRGIDTVGHVFHCNNLFENPTCTEYKHMLTGPPQKLTSKFKLSFNLALNLFASDTTGENSLARFTQQSLLHTDIQQDLTFYQKEELELTRAVERKKERLALCRTPHATLQTYTDLTNSLPTTTNSARKKLRQELTALEVTHKFLVAELPHLVALTDVEHALAKSRLRQANERDYIASTSRCVEAILINNEFLTVAKQLQTKGVVACHLQEAHPLVLADAYVETDGFLNYSGLDLVGIFACFNNSRVSDDLKTHQPHTGSAQVNTLSLFMANKLAYYSDLETKALIDTGSAADFNYDIQTAVMDWYAALDEDTCKAVITQVKKEKDIFLGEFIKVILKINNMCAEFEQICELTGNLGLLEKVKAIPGKLLKYVVTNQSLYL